ncbi:C-C motif chemokine 3-like [Tachysurus vachellii]|uniref:C-C motif chemokine 3-like n=1 Tax=Tachysurus vachellii TaxID=175792 RepID=UPI00296AC458|nr:C-C motif chemokine 3-like [Tachysurus vachellii]
MSSRSLLLVLLVLACLQSFTTAQNGNVPEEYQCCFRFQIQPIPVRVIKEYEVTDIRCTKPGVIFTLQNGRHLCADPSFKWVKNHMSKLDQRLFNSLNKPTAGP